MSAEIVMLLLIAVCLLERIAVKLRAVPPPSRLFRIGMGVALIATALLTAHQAFAAERPPDYRALNVCMRWIDHHRVKDDGYPHPDAAGRAQEDALAKIVHDLTHTKVDKLAMREFIETWCTLHTDESMVIAAYGYAAVLSGDLTEDEVMR